MKETRMPPNRRFADRKWILTGGVLSTFLGYELLDTVRLITLLPDWQPIVASPQLYRWLFWLLLLHGGFWIGLSLYQVRFLVSSEHMRHHLVSLFARRHPLLLYMPVFLLHSILALLFVLLTGNHQLGIVLASLTLWHTLIFLSLAPMLVSGGK